MTKLAWISAACVLAACRGDRPTQPGTVAAAAAAPIHFGAPARFGPLRLRQGHVQSLAFVGPTTLDVLTWDGVIAGDSPEHAAENQLVRWELAAGKRAAVAGSDSPITDAAFAPRAHVVAIATRDGEVELSDDGDFMPRWKTPLGRGISGVAISPDGAHVLVGEDHGHLDALDGASGAIAWQGAGLRGYASVLAYSPTGRYVAVGGDDDDVLVLDGRTHALVARLHHPAPSEESDRPHGVLSLAFAPDERALATGGWDDTIRVFALPSGARGLAIRTPADPFALAYSPDGTWLVYGGRDHDLGLWHARDGAPGPIVDASPRGVGDDSWKAIAAVAFSPDGKTLASGSWDGTFRTWDVDALTRGAVGPSGRAHAIALSRDGRTLISIGDDRRVVTWDAATGAERVELANDDAWAHDLAIAPDARAVARASTGRLAIVELPAGTTRATIAGDVGALDGVVAFSSDGGRVLALVDGHLGLYDARTGARVVTIPAAADARSVGFTDHDRAVWWLGEDLHVVDANTLASRAIVAHAGDHATRAVVSPDGRAVAVDGPTVTVWDVATAKPRFKRDHAVDLAWSADGATLAVAAYDGAIDAVDAETGNVVASVKLDADGSPTAVATGPDGEIVAAGEDGVVELWRPQ